MRKRFLTLLVAAASVFFGCNDKNGTTPDIIEPDLSGAPELPADPQPANSSFNHRIMLLQHTGTYCPNCPNLMTSLKELAQDNEYLNKYIHVASHSYNEDGDRAYSEAAAKISQAFCSGYYPELTFNLTSESTGTSIAASTIKSMIDGLHKETADVGIAAAAKIMNDGNLGIITEIKTAIEGNYRIAVWLLEDGIESEQMGATADWQHIHNNALRAMAGGTLNQRIYGEKVGIVLPGEKQSSTFVIKTDKDWNMDNCKVIVLANVQQPDGRFDVANCIVCPVEGSVTYDYK